VGTLSSRYKLDGSVPFFLVRPSSSFVYHTDASRTLQDYSAILTHGGDVYVWWQPSQATVIDAAVAAGEADLASPSTEGIVFPLQLDTLRLPSLPSSSEHPNDKVDVVAAGDNFLIALTTSSQLYYLDLSPVPPPQGVRDDRDDDSGRSRASVERLAATFLAGRRGWKPMSRFHDGGKAVTHVSAHFKSFAACTSLPFALSTILFGFLTFPPLASLRRLRSRFRRSCWLSRTTR
jgi:hypothetical protein